MTCADIQLNGVDFITFGVDLVPSVETFGVEIFTDFGFVVDGRGQGSCDNFWARCGSKSGNTRKDGGKDETAGELHCCDDSSATSLV